MKLLYHPVFIICCVFFVLHQFTQKILGVAIPLADSYLDNLLTTPILLTLLVVERRILFRRGPDYALNNVEVIMATLLIALISELLFPYLSDKFTGSWLDVLCYMLGSVLFYTTINRSS